MQNAPNITQLLQDWSNGKSDVLDELLPLVYDELRRQAARFLKKERDGHTLQTTALIHEAYLKLIGQKEVEWQNRNHFLRLPRPQCGGFWWITPKTPSGKTWWKCRKSAVG